MKTSPFPIWVLLVTQIFFSETLMAETMQTYKVSLSSGVLPNATADPQTHIIGVVQAKHAVRVRVYLSEIILGTGSKIRFVSLADGQSQELDTVQLGIWSNSSAIFNGDSVRIELVVASGDPGASVHIKKMLGFEDQTIVDGEPGCCGTIVPLTLCGPDDRIASTDNRVGRLMPVGCTAWLTSNGALLTAEHCKVVSTQIFQVNVPASQANGNTVAPPVQDQFPVLAGSIVSATNNTVDSDGKDLELGDDWTVFRVGPNNLGQSAHALHGFFRMTREIPAVEATIRITGCGTDDTPVGTTGMRNAQNQTLQTATGSFVSESGAEPKISLQYAVDSMGGNSGSPVIWESTGFAIGIHTNGGCSASGGSNNGTSFELNALENAIAAVPGTNCRYLDLVKAPGGAENGTVFQPHDTLTEALNSVPVGGRLSVVVGTYSAAGTTITKPMIITAPVGSVVFGD